MKVKVYRNLKHGKNAPKLYSVVALSGPQKGRVIARLNRVLLSNVEFKVSEAGRQRVLKSGCKNVHAWVIGDLANGTGCMGTDQNGKLTNWIVTYDPFKYGWFYHPNAGTISYPGSDHKVTHAMAVLLNEHGMTAAYAD